MTATLKVMAPEGLWCLCCDLGVNPLEAAPWGSVRRQPPNRPGIGLDSVAGFQDRVTIVTGARSTGRTPDRSSTATQRDPMRARAEAMAVWSFFPL
jgi:hypothetical protein